MNAPRRARASRALNVFKILAPILVIALYAAFKVGTSPARGRSTPYPLAAAPGSLSGVLPERGDPLKLTEEQRSFVRRLESLRSTNDWRGIVEEVRASRNAALTSHPVVQAMGAVARTRRGERGHDIENALAGLEAQLRPVEREHPELLHELRVSRVRVMLERLNTGDALMRNMDVVRQLLGERPRSTDDLEVRLQLARRFENVGDALREDATGVFSDDLVMVREARIYYQHGLRWIVEPTRWMELAAVSQSARPEIERLVQKLRMANRQVHGPSLPLTDNDSQTWTGRRGDPVHDMPRGIP